MNGIYFLSSINQIFHRSLLMSHNSSWKMCVNGLELGIEIKRVRLGEGETGELVLRFILRLSLNVESHTHVS